MREMRLPIGLNATDLIDAAISIRNCGDLAEFLDQREAGKGVDSPWTRREADEWADNYEADTRTLAAHLDIAANEIVSRAARRLQAQLIGR